MKDRIYFYPIWVRSWHAINALMFLVLIFTGFSIQYATTSVSWIRFDRAVVVHDIAGLILTFNYLIFLFGNILSDNGRFYRFTLKGGLNRLIQQFHFYTMGIFKGAPYPFPINKYRKFNPLQKLTYLLSMYLGIPLMIITGLTLYFPAVFNLIGLTSLVISDLIHILLGYFLSIFMVIHVYFCTIGHTVTSNFKSMLNGWHELH
ncbi:MAG: cytochrome b/b6 domain-containing protein [Bacteroidetes bacterium]|nr:cytochrome b/b6 domain-containing protein [Bacteroidota bacterium]